MSYTIADPKDADLANSFDRTDVSFPPMPRYVTVVEPRFSDLKALVEDMRAQRSRPWWRRLAG
jgi:hypothetical protein